jgi:predicted ATPase/DNA-binding CsgD family transcriptional regulator
VPDLLESRIHCLVPAQPTTLIGREGDLELAQRILARPGVRLLTISGPGGTGKTRLAIALAQKMASSFEDGVFFVDLARLERSEAVLHAIAQTVGVRDGADGSHELLFQVLSSSRTLLVLDNFEHVLSAAEDVAELLGRCAELKIVVTSQAALRLRWEHLYPLGPLSLPSYRATDAAGVSESSAVRLFVERAQAADPTFELSDENAATIAEVCSRLDGMPLAIELAAARVRLLAPRALLARLGQRLDLLVDGAVDLPDRQRTLRKAIGYSFDLLSVEEQALFCQLAVFVGGCTLEGAAALQGLSSPAAERSGSSAPLATISEQLQSLTHKSLLYQESLPNGETRFQMLESVRSYALEALEEAGELEAARQRWLTYLLDLAERSRQALHTQAQGAWLELLERDHDNFRAALRWCIDSGQAEPGLNLAGALWRFWFVRGLLSEGRRWLEELLVLPSAQPRTVGRARALSAAGTLAYNQGDDASAQALEQESLGIRRELGDRSGVAASLSTLGLLAQRRNDLRQATSLFEESLALKRELADEWGVAEVLHHLGEIAVEQSQYAAARARFEESMLQWQMLGDNWSVALSLESFAALALAQNQPKRALQLAGAATALRESGRGETNIGARWLRLQKTRDAAEKALGQDAARAAFESGRAMGMHEAVRFARTLPETPQPVTPVAAASSSLKAGPLASLTAREQEVAQLLLRGRSNRQIAEVLIITERTAETHVCRILNKLGLDSRAQLAALVMDGGRTSIDAARAS